MVESTDGAIDDGAIAVRIPKHAKIKTDVQGSTPQIVCAEPEVVRDLKLDPKTGEVAK